jgi:excisionase family DNA binding protein
MHPAAFHGNRTAMMARKSTQQLLTVEQIAEEFQVTPQTIRNWIKGGALQAVRVGHVFRVRREDLDAMIARQQGEAAVLGSQRDLWAPESLGLPYKPREGERPPSVWDGVGTPIAAPGRS